MIELTSKLHTIETQQDNVNNELRISKLKYIIEKLKIIKDNDQKLKQPVCVHDNLVYYITFE